MTIAEILENSPLTSYRGSEKTYKDIYNQIKERWGVKVAKKYNPKLNCRSFASWVSLGYKPRKGEPSLRSTTLVEVKDSLGNVVKKFPRTVYLFYVGQVEQISK